VECGGQKQGAKHRGRDAADHGEATAITANTSAGYPRRDYCM